jgi:hypothetical protein
MVKQSNRTTDETVLVSLVFSVQFNVQIIRINTGLKSNGPRAGWSYLLSTVQVHTTTPQLTPGF